MNYVPTKGVPNIIIMPLTDVPDYRNDTVLPLPPEVSADAWAVDAACSGNPGKMEYRGVDLATGAQVFHYGPVFGTNNIGEFLAIVHALAMMEQKGVRKTIYSDKLHGHNVGQEDAVQDQGWSLIRRPSPCTMSSAVPKRGSRRTSSACQSYSGTRASGATYRPTSGGKND